MIRYSPSYLFPGVISLSIQEPSNVLRSPAMQRPQPTIYLPSTAPSRLAYPHGSLDGCATIFLDLQRRAKPKHRRGAARSEAELEAASAARAWELERGCTLPSPSILPPTPQAVSGRQGAQGRVPRYSLPKFQKTPWVFLPNFSILERHRSGSSLVEALRGGVCPFFEKGK